MIPIFIILCLNTVTLFSMDNISYEKDEQSITTTLSYIPHYHHKEDESEQLEKVRRYTTFIDYITLGNLSENSLDKNSYSKR